MISFELDGKEERDAKAWMKEHMETCRCAKSHSIDGARFTFTFTPNSIGGPIVHVHCFCGQDKDVTDYDVW